MHFDPEILQNLNKELARKLKKSSQWESVSVDPDKNNQLGFAVFFKRKNSKKSESDSLTPEEMLLLQKMILKALDRAYDKELQNEDAEGYPRYQKFHEFCLMTAVVLGILCTIATIALMFSPLAPAVMVAAGLTLLGLSLGAGGLSLTAIQNKLYKSLYPNKKFTEAQKIIKKLIHTDHFKHGAPPAKVDTPKTESNKQDELLNESSKTAIFHTQGRTPPQPPPRSNNLSVGTPPPSHHK